jgi:hypothetical protein
MVIEDEADVGESVGGSVLVGVTEGMKLGSEVAVAVGA